MRRSVRRTVLRLAVFSLFVSFLARSGPARKIGPQASRFSGLEWEDEE